MFTNRAFYCRIVLPPNVMTFVKKYKNLVLYVFSIFTHVVEQILYYYDGLVFSHSYTHITSNGDWLVY